MKMATFEACLQELAALVKAPAFQEKPATQLPTETWRGVFCFRVLGWFPFELGRSATHLRDVVHMPQV